MALSVTGIGEVEQSCALDLAIITPELRGYTRRWGG